MRKKLLFIVLLVFIVTTLSLAACNNNNLSSESITYDGEYIRWEEVIGVSTYRVSINEGEAVEVNGTEYLYITQTSFIVTITTVPEYEVLGQKLGKEIEMTKAFTYLPQVLNVSFNDGLVSWDTVEGAESYKIQINDGIAANNLIANTYTVADNVTGQTAIRVIPQASTSHFSKWSDVLTLYILPTPKNLSYNGDTLMLSWDSVSQASKYKVTINGGEAIEVQGTSLPYNANRTNFNVKVQSVGNGSNIVSSKISEKVDYYYLAPILHFSVNDGVLSWEEIENATSYKLKVTHQGADNIFEQTDRVYPGLEPGKSYTISVFPMATSKNYFSSWSTTETITLLSIPGNVSYNSNNYITWQGVSNATSYKIAYFKDGDLLSSEIMGVDGNTGINVLNKFNEVGEYQVKVQANTNQATYYASKFSDPITIVRLAKPASYTVTDDSAYDGTTRVNFSAVTGASSYRIQYDDTTYTTTAENTFKPKFSDTAVEDADEITINIFSLGSQAGKRYVLESLDALTFTLKRLGTPQNVRVDNGRVKWDNVLDNSGYFVYIGGSNATELSGTDFILPKIAPGTHKITVRAKGNGSNVVSSVLSNEYEVTKLAAPANLQVSNRKITWSQVNGTTGYKLSIVQENLGTDITEYQIDESTITTEGTIINVTALGNGAEIIDSDISDEKTVRKLAPPTNIRLAITGNKAIWNPPTNAHSNTISYNVQISQQNVANGEGLTAPEWHTSNLSVGGNAIRVKAKGDGSETFDSEYSQIVEITKLAPMNVSVSADKTKYVWGHVNSASSYTYRIGNGNDQTLSNLITEWKPNFTVAKTEETLYFKAKGNYNNNVCDSEEVIVSLVIKALGKIDNDKISFDCDTEAGKITVTVSEDYTTEHPENAQEFIYITSGTQNKIPTRTFVYTFSGTPKIDFKVKAVGGYFGDKQNGKDVYYVDSDASDQKSIEVLPSPTIELTRQTGGGFMVTFKDLPTVGHFKGIEYEIIYYTSDGVEKDDVKLTNYLSFYINKETLTEKNATHVEISARVVGNNDHGTYNSKWKNSTKTSVNLQ